MEEQYYTLIAKLNEKSQTHPRVTRMWKTYLQTKFLNLSKAFVNCHEALRIMEQCDDIHPETLLAMLFLLNW